MTPTMSATEDMNIDPSLAGIGVRERDKDWEMAKLLTANTHQQPGQGSSPGQTPVSEYWSPSSQGDRQEDPGGERGNTSVVVKGRKRGNRAEKRNSTGGITSGGVVREAAERGSMRDVENTASAAERYMRRERLIKEAIEAKERMINASREASEQRRRLEELEGELGELEREGR